MPSCHHRSISLRRTLRHVCVWSSIFAMLTAFGAVQGINNPAIAQPSTCKSAESSQTVPLDWSSELASYFCRNPGGHNKLKYTYLHYLQVAGELTVKRLDSILAEDIQACCESWRTAIQYQLLLCFSHYPLYQQSDY